MPNYEKGKIYKITVENEAECYIGSTCMSLTRRFSNHKSGYTTWLKKNKISSGKVKVYDLFEKYGTDKCSIELLESRSCKNKDELHQLEDYYLQNTPNKVNHYMATKPTKEKIMEWRTIRHDCECGGSYNNGNKGCHLKSKRHQEWKNKF